MEGRRFVRALTALVAVVTLLISGCSYVVDRSNAGISSLEEAPSPVGPVARGGKYVGWGLAAPAVLALSPVAALAWATPWVDLPLAVDIASAPAIGLGYAVSAIAGSPVRVAAAPWLEDPLESPDGPPTDRTRPPPVPWGFIVEHRKPLSDPRPARPLPVEIEAYYAVSDAEVQRLREELEAARRAAGSRRPTVRVAFRAGSPSTLEFYPAGDESADRPGPLVLMTPPSKAAYAARYLARWFARRGFHAAVIVPERSFLEPHLGPAEVEGVFRQAAINARTALRALATLAEVDGERLDYLGVSAGGIFGAALLAVEPSIRRAVLILTGSDLPRIVAESDDSSAVAYREAWRQRGLDGEALLADLTREMRSDPARLAEFIDPRRVLLFLGSHDTRIPTDTGLALWRALGAPELYLLSGNHETASLCFGFVLRRSARFLSEGR